jgi:hypothetical protein
MSTYTNGRRVIDDDETPADGIPIANPAAAPPIAAPAETRGYNCGRCGEQGHPSHKCPLLTLLRQFEADAASLFKSGKISGSITLEASIDGKPFTIKAKLTHSRFSDLCTDLDAHVLDGIKFQVSSAVKKISIKRSAAEAELSAKQEALAAKRKKQDAEDFETLQELRRAAALSADETETSGSEAAAPAAPSSSFFGFSWGRRTEHAE